MKKVIALVLSLCLILAAVPSLALELKSGGDTYPLTTDKTISWYSQDNILLHETIGTVEESPFHTNLAKKLGVNIEWRFPTTGSDGATYTNALLADPSNLPMIMEGYFMNNAGQYIADELIWDLTDYIQEYAPAYYAFLQSNSAYDRAMKTDDGKYYAFGFFREDGGWNDTYMGPVVRTDWLAECGLEMPKTIADFENVMRVFKERYGAQFTFSFTNRFNMSGLTGAFGGYGSSRADWGYYVKDGKVNLGQAQPEWRAYMTWLNQMWDDGLIDQDALSLDDTTVKAKVQNDKTGIAYTSMGQMNNWNKDMVANGKEAAWAGCPYPTDANGELSSVFGGYGIGNQTVVITKSASEDEMKLCLQMLDYAYTQEGFLYWNYGVEGDSWEYNAEGVPTFTALVTDDTSTDPMTKYNGATWGYACIQATNLLYLKNSPAAIAANDTWFYNFEDTAKNEQVTAGWRWPVGVTFTVEESDELDLYMSNLDTYVQESFSAFLTGTKDSTSDAEWQAYLDGLESLHLSRVLELRQGCYERYLAR